uniref:Uncharacterized protein n=1 Tax=Lepeophtheirus salmonis TaxID=72036 RepID=A0A0K2SWC0_LEPSM
MRSFQCQSLCILSIVISNKVKVVHAINN